MTNETEVEIQKIRSLPEGKIGFWVVAQGTNRKLAKKLQLGKAKLNQDNGK